MVSYKGFDTKYITMQCVNAMPDKINVGDFVKINENGNVFLADIGKALPQAKQLTKVAKLSLRYQRAFKPKQFRM